MYKLNTTSLRWFVVLLVPLLCYSEGKAQNTKNILEWTWVHGDTAGTGTAIYGTKGSGSSFTTPGNRYYAKGFTDATGSMWLFGGFSVGSQTSPTAPSVLQNDLWKWDGSKWNWMHGDTNITSTPSGHYGTKGVASKFNVPGKRSDYASWYDSKGNFWIYGGRWFNYTNGPTTVFAGQYNDLWKWDGTNWTWVSGDSTVQQYGNSTNSGIKNSLYGTKGIGSSKTTPGDRFNSTTWIDKNDNLWLFGGSSVDGIRNDLWKWDGNKWIWMYGDSTILGTGYYAQKGVGSSRTIPCARRYGHSWTDSADNLFLFGGYAWDSTRIGHMNDVWKFDGSKWIWLHGSSSTGQSPVFDSIGQPTVLGGPGGTQEASVHKDSKGNIWLWSGGGSGNRPWGNRVCPMWVWQDSAWIWIEDSTSYGRKPRYGTQGVADTLNTPGTGRAGVYWTGADGKMYIYGGLRSTLKHQDLWSFKPEIQSPSTSVVCTLGLTLEAAKTSCYFGADGSISTKVTGANGAVTYDWENGADVPSWYAGAKDSSGAAVSGLRAYTYLLTVSDGSCSVTDSITITQPSRVLATATRISNESCPGAKNGIAFIDSTRGGTAPYTYEWISNGDTRSTVDTFGAGLWFLRATDANGCQGTDSVKIVALNNCTSLCTLQVQLSAANNVTCHFGTDGAIEANVTGASGSISYDWENGADIPFWYAGAKDSTGASISDMRAGTYVLTVTSGGCTVTDSFTLAQPERVVTAATRISNESCEGAKNGSAFVDSTFGGTSPYSYSWISNGDSNLRVDTLSAGLWFLRATDANGCQGTDTVLIKTLNSVSVSATVDSHVTCFAGNNGKASAEVIGGTSPFSFSWSSGSNDSFATSLVAGNYQVVITDGKGCKDSSSVTITEPIVLQAGAIDGDTTICSGALPNKLRAIAPTMGGVGNYTYQWQVSTDSSNWSDISSATSADYQPGAIQGNNWFRRLDSDSNNCSPDTTNVLKVGVFAQPSTGFTASTACLGQQTNFTDTTSLAFGTIKSYAWSFGDQGTSNQQNPVNIYKSSGSYTVSLTVLAEGGCNSTVTKTISVNPVPVTNFSATAECEGDATAFTNGSTISAGSLSYSWDLGDNNSSVATSPSHSYANAGFYTVQLVATSAAGCVDSVSKTVQVKNVAKPNFSATAVCEGISTSFTNLSASASSYSWNFGDASGTSAKANPGYTYAASGSYTVVLTATSTDGCSDTAQRLVEVYGLPTAAFSASTECLGDATSFTNNSSGASAYQWIFGNGTSSNNASPSVIYGKDGNYTVELTATTSNGCRDVTSASVTVNALPKVAFAAADICLSEDLITSNTTTGATSYAWNFGDGNASVATAPAHTYASHGQYRVSLVARSGDGCIDSAASMINAYAVPSVNYSVSDVCFGVSSQFRNRSSIAAGTMTYVWDLGDGSSTGNPSPSYAYSADGNYSVKLVATSNNGCKDSLTTTTEVFAMPVVDFTTASVCNGDTLFTNNLSSGAASYAWSFGDGATSADVSPFNLYADAGEYNVQLIATTSNNCIDSLTKGISIFSKPVAGFDVKDVCDEQLVQFANSSYNAIITGNAWSFGDATSDNRVNPDKLYAADGSYAVELIVSSNEGCLDTVVKTVTVHPNPVVAFTNTTECDYDATVFTNGSSISSGTMTHEWDFGTGDVSNLVSPDFHFPAAGTYSVGLTTTSDQGCVQSLRKIVRVNPAPVAAIDLDNNCEGDLSQLASVSSVSTGSIASYEWDLGDGALSSLEKLSHLYGADGSYTVELVVTSDEACTDTTSATLVVYNKPTASFSTPDVCFGQLNVFTDNSVDASEYIYDFGDKWGISTNAAPEYTYENPGSYDATLFVTSAFGCKDTVQNTLTIHELPKSQFAIRPHCLNTPVVINNRSQGDITSWDWDFDDGTTMTGESPTKVYSKDGTYLVKLTVTDANSCIDSMRRVATIYPLPDVWVRADTFVSKGYEVPLEARGGVAYKWNPVEQLDRPLTATPIATVIEDITYTVTVGNEFGCSKDTFVTLRVEDDYTLEPSNIMTPDGNGQNDNWIVEKAQYYNDVEVIVFDRWGRIVYQNANYDNTWNGVSQITLESLPDGSYFYIVKVPAEREAYKGSITIFR